MSNEFAKDILSQTIADLRVAAMNFEVHRRYTPTSGADDFAADLLKQSIDRLEAVCCVIDHET